MTKYFGIIFLLLICTGCNGVQSPPMSLVSMPLTSMENKELIRTVEKSLPSNTDLILPLKTEQDKITLLKNDHVIRHAAVFYKGENEATNLKVGLFSNLKGDGWVKSAVFPLEGFDISSVHVEDMNDDGDDELFIGTILGDHPQQQKVHLLTQNEVGVWSISPVGQFHQYEIGDLAGRGNILYALEFNRNISAKLLAYKMEADSLLSKKSEVSVMEYVNGYEKMLIGKVNDKDEGIFLDASQGANTGQSMVIISKNGQLTSATEEVGFPLYKPRLVFSEDVNHDGIIEVGSLYEPDGWDDVSLAEMPWVHAYYQLTSDNSFKMVHERYADFDAGFFIDFPKEWYQSVTFSKEAGPNELIIITKNKKKKVFHVKWLPTKEAHLMGANWKTLYVTPSNTFFIPKEAKYIAYENYVRLLAELK